MSDEEEGAVVKSQWTTGATPTTAPAEVSCSAAIQSLPIAEHTSKRQLILLFVVSMYMYVCLSCFGSFITVHKRKVIILACMHTC